MNKPANSFVRRHLVKLGIVAGLAAYLLVAGSTESCPACSSFTRAIGLPSLVTSAQAAAPRAADLSAAKAPDWELRNLEGQVVRFTDFSGKIVVVNFWATWCPPCRAEIPHFVELQAQLGEQGLVVVGISLDAQGVAAVKPFAERFGINYPLVMGDPGVVAAFGGVRSIPTTFIIDRTGRVVDRHVGYGSKSDFEQKIVPLL